MTILDFVGETPLVEVPLAPKGRKIFAKLEGHNPCGSVKDRPALWMVRDALMSGKLKPGGTVVEATSGNTGIALAFVCAALKLNCVLFMPENMTPERIMMMKIFGAKLVLTPSNNGMGGAISAVKEYVREFPDAFWVDQFSNPVNPLAHRMTTAPEILRQLGSVPDAFVAGVGSGGTLTGCAEFFKKERKARVRVVAVEPEESAVISGRQPGKHDIPGIGAGFIPHNYEASIVDEVVTVLSEEAKEIARKIMSYTGISVGISSGANMLASIKVAQNMSENSVIVTIFPDRADRYISMYNGL